MLGLILGAASLVGTGLSLFGNYQQNEANKAANKKYNAEKKRVAKLNYNYQLKAATANRDTGYEQASIYQTQGEHALSTQKATAATAGTMSGGSSTLIQAASKNNLRLDLDQMKKNVNTQYYLALEQAKVTLEQGSVETPYTADAGMGFSNIGTLLNGFTNAYGAYRMGTT